MAGLAAAIGFVAGGDGAADSLIAAALALVILCAAVLLVNLAAAPSGLAADQASEQAALASEVQRLEHEKSQTTPRLVFHDEPWGGRVRMFARILFAGSQTELVGQPVEVKETPHIIGIYVANNPPGRRAEAVCTNALVELLFFGEGEDKPVLPPLAGRWTTNTQSITKDLGVSDDDLKRRDLVPTGEQNAIDIALYYPNTNELYAAGHDIWLKQSRDDAMKLDPAQTYEVQVTIVATGFEQPAVARYRLRKTDDPDQPLELSRIPDNA